MTQTTIQHCPLCLGQDYSAYCRDKYREYLHCANCELVFVPPQFHLSRQEEKSIYDQHQNDPADTGYRKFLSRLFEPLAQRLAPQATGLDFGCGPGPTLSVMFTEAGFPVALYDKFYADQKHQLQQNYDFITASEVVEHLSQPRQELDRLFSLLNNNGYLGLMTKLVTDQQAFSTWHYKNDRSHISFFAKNSFIWLAKHWQAQLEFIGNDVILLQKQ